MKINGSNLSLTLHIGFTVCVEAEKLSKCILCVNLAST